MTAATIAVVAGLVCAAVFGAALGYVLGRRAAAHDTDTGRWRRREYDDDPRAADRRPTTRGRRR